MSIERTETDIELTLTLRAAARVGDADTLARELALSLDSPLPLVSLDLEGLNAVDVTFFQLLLALRRSLQTQGRHLTVKAAGPGPRCDPDGTAARSAAGASSDPGGGRLMTFQENSELFLEEAQELLEKAETSLLELEKQPGDREQVNEVFRALHTIKGSGAMFGFREVSGIHPPCGESVRRGPQGQTRRGRRHRGHRPAVGGLHFAAVDQPRGGKNGIGCF